MRFRPNIVVYGSTPYNEDNWKRLHIGDAYFTVSAFPLWIPLSEETLINRMLIRAKLFADTFTETQYKPDDLPLYSVQFIYFVLKPLYNLYFFLKPLYNSY